jgi:hypothetical protein
MSKYVALLARPGARPLGLACGLGWLSFASYGFATVLAVALGLLVVGCLTTDSSWLLVGTAGIAGCDNRRVVAGAPRFARIDQRAPAVVSQDSRRPA